MRFILEKLQGIADHAARRTEAERLLEIFSSGQESVPKGIAIVDAFRDERQTVEAMGSYLAQTREFFTELATLMGGTDSPQYRLAVDRFDRNAAQSLKLAAMDEHERRALPPHELQPYFDDFDRAVLWGRWGLRDDIIPSTTVIGSGGFATVYEAAGKDGTPLALKVFHPREKAGIFDTDMLCSQSSIIHNVEQRKALLSDPPFVPLVTTGFSSLNWYAAKRFDGRSLTELLTAGALTPSTIGRSMVAYCAMLGVLHAQGLMFVDNSLGNVLVGPDDVRVCDYDFVSEPDASWRPRVSTFVTASREQLSGSPLTYQSDTEGAALMLDALANGALWRDWKAQDEDRARAKANRRTYPKERAAKLPRRTRQVVKGLLSYPRDPSLTVEDLESSLRADYGL